MSEEQKEIPLSEDLEWWRAERPDEWIMDRFIKKPRQWNGHYLN
jgi:hypothetical protein